jgi:spore maturation protein CgeB
MTDAIAEALDIDSEMVVYTDLEQAIKVAIPEQTIENDITEARNNMYKMVAVGENTLLSAINMMNEMPTARVVETITGLIKAMSDISQDIVSLHPPVDKNIIDDDGAEFVGTTEDFLASEDAKIEDD